MIKYLLITLTVLTFISCDSMKVEDLPDDIQQKHVIVNLRKTTEGLSQFNVEETSDTCLKRRWADGFFNGKPREWIINLREIKAKLVIEGFDSNDRPTGINFSKNVILRTECIFENGKEGEGNIKDIDLIKKELILPAQSLGEVFEKLKEYDKQSPDSKIKILLYNQDGTSFSVADIAYEQGDFRVDRRSPEGNGKTIEVEYQNSIKLDLLFQDVEF